MLQLYLDDAGSQDDPKNDIFVVGGYIAPEEVWTSFIAAWQGVLEGRGAPPYHAADCEPGKNGFGHGLFDRWSSARLLELKKQLAPLTHMLLKHGGAGVGRGVLVSEFEVSLAHDPLFRGMVPHVAKYCPLFFCLNAVLDWVACAWPGRPSQGKISVIFEDGTRYAGAAADLFSWLRRTQSWADGAFNSSFSRAGKDLVPLQAADMLAFELYKLKDRQRADPPRQERKLFSVLRQCEGLSVKFAQAEDYPLIRNELGQWVKDRLERGEEAI